MTRSDRIRDSLTKAFAPDALDVVDDSHKHAGHAGASPEGETHYTVIISSPAFAGLSRVAVQRAIMAELKPEFETGLHALSIKARS
ncbi:MAG: BolA family protein [Pseudomonadota bacterium]